MFYKNCHYCLTCTTHTSSTRNSQAISLTALKQQPPRSLKSQVFYAVVVHDFVAERTDELDAKAGDPISVVAQSNREWFVAKPIGRLGKPGLIPVSFVQVRDPVTNQPIDDIEMLMDNGSLPRVEEWKKQQLHYKANSITLGILEDPVSPGLGAVSPTTPPAFESGPRISISEPSPESQQDQPPSPVEQPPSLTILPDGLLLSAEVVSFHYEMEEYWFRIHALYQPYNSSSSDSLPPATELLLFRAYNDFFEYQTALLDTFPREAGKREPHPRILPYMPGPATNVNDQLTATRREELHEYLQHLCRLNRSTARYILEHHLTSNTAIPINAPLFTFKTTNNSWSPMK